MALSNPSSPGVGTFADPATRRSAPVVKATLSNGHARVSAGSFNWEADLPGVLGGDGLAPTPTAYLLGALAACGVVFLRDTLAPEFGVTVDHVEATATCSADLGGLVGLDGALPDLTDLRITISVMSPDPAERTDAMFAAWRARCPIYLALRNPNAVTLETAVGAPS